MNLHGSTVLVTGGAGLIASHIVDGLLRAGVREAVVFDNLVRGGVGNLSAALTRRPVRVIQRDIPDRAAASLDEGPRRLVAWWHQERKAA